MTQYKKSYYNFVFEAKDVGSTEKIIYNALSGAIAILDANQYNILNNLENATRENEELINMLLENGFIVSDYEKEQMILEYKLFSSRFKSDELNLTIVPTSNCNFDCIYCYEKNVIGDYKMTTDIQDKLVSFIEESISNITCLSVTWYGGEPLLAFDVIECLSKKLIDLCDTNNVKYNASIITNGYLLDSLVAEKMNQLKIETMQITLDGSREIHDRRRPLKGGGKTFDIIVENIRRIKNSYNGEIIIRINIDKSNENDIHEIDSVLLNNAHNVNAYVARVENDNDTYVDNICLSPREFSLIEYNYNHKDVDADSFVLETRGNFCCADQSSSFIIDADGFIYKCWSEIGQKSKSICRIGEGIRNISLIYDYLFYNPMEDIQCGKCKYLPLCMGGCPHKRMNGYADRCLHIKYTLEKYIRCMKMIG